MLNYFTKCLDKIITVFGGIPQGFHICDVVQAAQATRFLLLNPIFDGLYGRIGGTNLYDIFIQRAEEQLENMSSAGKGIYELMINVAKALREYEEKREPLPEPTNVRRTMRDPDDGTIYHYDGNTVMKLGPDGNVVIYREV